MYKKILIKRPLAVFLWVMVLSGCSFLTDPREEKNGQMLSVADIIAEYNKVDSLNLQSWNGELDTSKIKRQVFIGRDERNELSIIRRCDKQRLFGCMLYYNVFGLFYEACDSAECVDIDFGVPVVDHEGITGTPRFIGCAPDTSA